MSKTVSRLLDGCESGFLMTITKTAGPHSGEVFTGHVAVMEDESKMTVFISSHQDGYFKQVIVPLDFEHDAIIE